MERKRVLLFRVDLCQAVQGLCQTLFKLAFLPQHILRILVQQYGVNFEFWRQRDISKNQRVGKIRSSKVDVLLKQTKLDSIGIMRQK